jgi:hypothetical protein
MKPSISGFVGKKMLEKLTQKVITKRLPKAVRMTSSRDHLAENPDRNEQS